MAVSSRDRVAAWGLAIVLGSFLVAWLVSPGRKPAAPNPNNVGVDPGNVPAGFVAAADAGERERIALERREADEDAADARRRMATTALIVWHSPHVRERIKILNSTELSFNRFAVEARVGSIDHFIVEGGGVVPISDEQYEWETMDPESLVSLWAGRELADGSYRVKSMTRAVTPPGFRAAVVNRQTGVRWIVEFSGFTPGGTANLATTQLDF